MTVCTPCSRRPHLTRSSLHRCLQRNGVSRLPQVEGEVTAKRTFKTYPIGYFHIDLAEVRTEQGKLDMLVAIDRTSTLDFVELHETAKRITAADFLRRLQPRPPAKDPEGPRAMRMRPQNLDKKPDRFSVDPTHQVPGLNI